MTDLPATIRAIFPSVVDDLKNLVRIGSVSADPQAADAVRASADAVADLARGAGAAEVQVVSVPNGGPAVIAHWPAPEGAPTVLLYAHHDVQPTGPTSEWTSPPFEPVERDGRLYGRGAADDKAGVCAHIAVLRAFDGSPPVGVTLFVEGEEEIGSPTFSAFLGAHKEALRADVIVVADSMNWTEEIPALTTSLRGLVDCTVELRVLDHAVHSGMFGGVVVDALTSLCRLLATLHDNKGDVAVKGLEAAGPAEVDIPESMARSLGGVLDGVELTGSGSIADRLWNKPALSIVGIDAPSVEESSNILIHQARAKISLRLAPNQDPQKALDALTEHLHAHSPFGAKVSVSDGTLGAGCAMDAATSAYDAARAAFEEAFGHRPVHIGVGGSIPFIADFESAFPEATILVTGVEDPDSRAHGVDESLHLEQFAKVCTGEALLLHRLSRDF